MCKSRVQVDTLGVAEKKNLEGAQVSMKIISVLRSKTVVMCGKPNQKYCDYEFFCTCAKTRRAIDDED